MVELRSGDRLELTWAGGRVELTVETPLKYQSCGHETSVLRLNGQAVWMLCRDCDHKAAVEGLVW